MKRLILLLFILPQFSWAQNKVFDIITYTPPVGWTEELKDFAVSYSTVDQKAGTWCRLTIYKSVPSSGNASQDFSSEWKAIVKPDTYVGSVEPVPQGQMADGWMINGGASKFTWQGKDAQLMLMNISGYGTMVTIMASMNSEKYSTEITDLFGSIVWNKPAGASQQVPSQPPGAAPESTTELKKVTPMSESAPIAVTNAFGPQGITTSTTNFDDGWVSQPYADYVKVVKGPVTVLLHYAIQIDDEMRQNEMTLVLWARLMQSRYTAKELQKFVNESYTYNRIYFISGNAVEIATGKNYYVGLRILVNNGIASCIEIISPSVDAFNKEFPNQDKIAAMVNYNKFAVSKGDIIGTWEESSSTGIDMYNTSTGQYAGMNTTASASSFTIKPDGSYDSNHKGAMGMVGSMKFYDQKYNGKYTVTPWDITMTNRFEGKTDVYWCEYEAVRGGRVLKLVDKTASGMRYNLVKVK